MTRRTPPSRVVLLALLASLTLHQSASAHQVASAGPDHAHVERAPAVAAPNVRIGAHWGWFHQDEIDTYAASPSSTLRIDEHSGHLGRLEIVGVLPVYGPLGLRVGLRGRYGERTRSLNGLERGNTEISDYGARASLLLRDPARGELSMGGGWARLARDGPKRAVEYSGHAGLAVFFPDLGLGPIDWRLGFEFTHREVSGIVGPTDFDGDRYAVSGESGWYANDDLQIVLGGRWHRSDDEFSREDDTEGFVQMRWWLRNSLPWRVPVELTLGASGGISEFRQVRFREDRRPVWRVNAGLVFRFGSGASLIDVVRRYD